MKKSTSDWLKSARNDLDTIAAIRDRHHLTPVIAFHAQQCVEKCLKALLEEYNIEIRRPHNLLTLKKAVEATHAIDLDEDMLSLLNKLYLDSRYPGELGLLPIGAPTLEDADQFADFAYEAHTMTSKHLQEDPFKYGS